MKKSLIIILCAALAAGVGCGKKEAESHDEHGHEKKHEEHEAGDKHGHEEAEREEGVVMLSEEAVVASKIQTIEAQAASGWITTRFPGRVDYDLNVTASASTQLEGRLEKWLVNVGDKVRAGDVLAQVQNPQNLDKPILVKAMIDGEVIERKGAPGTWVKPEDTLFVISDLSTVWAIAEVREDMVGKIRKDAPAKIRCLSHPDETFMGKILRAKTEVEVETRTVEFIIEVANPDRKLRTGMFTYISLATDAFENKVVVPDEAVQTIRGAPAVFVEEARGKYRLSPLKLGRKLGEAHEVFSGLAPDAKVVTTGSFILKSEYLRAELGEGHAH